MANFVKVCKTGEVKAGCGKSVDINGKAVGVFNVDGKFHVLDNTCLHRGGPLGEGELEANVVTCPWHGWQFNVTTGVCVNNPSAKVETYQVKVEGDDVKALL